MQSTPTAPIDEFELWGRKSSSHTSGRLYLPTFLFGNGSLTLIKWPFCWSSKILSLPFHNADIFNCCCMTCNVVLVILVMGPGKFFVSFTKWSSRFTNILFFTVHHATFLSIDGPTFLDNGIFVLWGHQKISDGLASLDMHLDAMFAADVLAAFTEPFGVWHHCVSLLLVFAQLFLVLLELLSVGLLYWVL